MRTKAKAAYLKALYLILALAGIIAAGGGKAKWF
jgi:hypothetical protein